jgi:hypothetical protein
VDVNTRLWQRCEWEDHVGRQLEDDGERSVWLAKNGSVRPRCVQVARFGGWRW